MMTLGELEYTVSGMMSDSATATVEDDKKWAEEEFSLVRDFCQERNFRLSKDETEYLEAIGYDPSDFVHA